MFLCFNVKELQNLLPWRAVRETGGKKQESIKLVRILKNELPISPNPPTSSLRRLQPCKLCVYCKRTPPACDLGFDMVSRRSEFFWGASWGFSWGFSVVQVFVKQFSIPYLVHVETDNLLWFLFISFRSAIFQDDFNLISEHPVAEFSIHIRWENSFAWLQVWGSTCTSFVYWKSGF